MGAGEEGVTGRRGDTGEGGRKNRYASIGRYAVIGCKVKQNANEGCNSCASLTRLVLCFIACFILLVIAP